MFLKCKDACYLFSNFYSFKEYLNKIHMSIKNKKFRNVFVDENAKLNFKTIFHCS